MSQDQEFRLGLIGLGGIALGAHGPAAKRCGADLRIAACCDVRPEAVATWQAAYGGTGYTDYLAMVRQEQLDGVLLATWPNQHREQIAKLLAAGVRTILCEKALALTSHEAVAIYDRVTRAGAFVMEGFMYRHNPVLRKLEQVLAAGHLGAVDHVRACFSAFDPETVPADDPHRNWRQRKECGGGIPYDFACYCVNCCGHFAGGLPVRVHCVGGLGKYGTINRMYGTIEYDNGVAASLESSKHCSYTQEVQISCAQGILNLPLAWTIDRNLTITQRHAGWNNTTCDTYVSDGVSDGVLSYQLQLANFVAAARGQAPPLIPLVESVVNTMTLEALVTSVLERRVVDVVIPARIARAYRAQVAAGQRA